MKALEWTRKSYKRELKKSREAIVKLAKTVKHFFKDLGGWIEKINDPRHKSYIQYTQSDLIYMGLIKNLCSVETMHEMEELFNEDTCIETLRLIAGDKGLNEMPHCDTLNYYLQKLSPDCLSEIRRKMIKSLVRSKVFYSHRISGKYWRIILDGTGIASFKEKHCDNCLIEQYTDKDGNKRRRHYHKILEAKIVLAENVVLSIGTEFIENENENVTKQDCELNAAKRLLARIKKEYPRLQVCLLGDGLYCTSTIASVCDKNRWAYIFTLKEGRQKQLSESFEAFKSGGDTSKKEKVSWEGGTAEFVNDVEETVDKCFKANIYEYRYQNDKDGEKKFRWLTSIRLTKKNIGEMVQAARGRWKIENEGFNTQKNILYHIEHLNSRNPVAMKNHYLLTQIADIIMQLYLAGNDIIRKVKQGKKITSSMLLESFRRHTITAEDVIYIEKHTAVHLNI